MWMTRKRARRTVAVAAVLAVVSVLLILRPSHVMPTVNRAELRSSGSCAFPVETGVEMTQGDRCFIGLLKRRCDARDVCYVDCITSGRGLEAAGGCAHICRYVGESWTFPAGTRACYSSDSDTRLPPI